MILPQHLNEQLAQQRDFFMTEDTDVGIIQSFLDNYSSDYVCTNLIYQEALDNRGKPDRRMVNEINDIMNNSIDGWKQKTGATKRFDKYGIQKYWYREKSVNKEFVPVPTQMEIPFDS